jgi:pimeloyl-ACP methyl ester carboxylesterase
MTKFSINRWIWWSWIYFIRACGLPFQLYPVNLQSEKAKLYAAVRHYDVVLIFNAGGWGEAPLSEASDFAPILGRIQETLAIREYSSIVVPYNRIPPGLSGRIAGIKEQANSFQNTYNLQAGDLRYLSEQFPEKRFILAGFSVGGGLSGKTLKQVADLPNVYGITVGAPGWYRTFSSDKSLVLNNNNRDPLSIGDVKTIAIYVFRGPFKWIWAKLNGRKLSLAWALQFPCHDYRWDSPEVGPPITKFLETHFKTRAPSCIAVSRIARDWQASS